MKPLNLDNRPCSPISSNCVIWQGPELTCINLCKGDTISDVVAKLAEELCTLLDQTNVSNYDLTCLGITSCGPKDFQALIELLIEKICELQGLPTDTTKKDPTCPDCIVTVAPCFIQNGQTTMQLIDYVNMIAKRVCSLISQINDLQEQINDLTIRVEILENTPPPTFTIPKITFSCAIGSLNPGQPYPIDIVLQTFINDVWCSMSSALGTPTELVNSIEQPCEFGTDVTSNPGWIANPTTLADSINNIWITLCELYSVISGIGLTVQDTPTINLDYTSGVLTANVQDTGWHNLEGFDFYTGAIAAFKPQCRRIGNQIHFRGIVYIPLATSVTGTTVIDLTNAFTYATSTQITPFIGIGGMYTDTSGFMYFNSNGGSAAQSVIPTNVLSAGTLIDNEYRLTNVLGFRKIVIGGSNITSLISNLGISITTDKRLKITTVDVFDAESSYAILNASPLRLVTSNVRSGEYIPNYITAASDINNAPSNANFPLVSDTYNLTWPFSCDASKTTNLGGFTFVLDGLTAYIDQCTEDIKNYNCIPV